MIFRAFNPRRPGELLLETSGQNDTGARALALELVSGAARELLLLVGVFVPCPGVDFYAA